MNTRFQFFLGRPSSSTKLFNESFFAGKIDEAIGLRDYWIYKNGTLKERTIQSFLKRPDRSKTLLQTGVPILSAQQKADIAPYWKKGLQMSSLILNLVIWNRMEVDEAGFQSFVSTLGEAPLGSAAFKFKHVDLVMIEVLSAELLF